MVGSGSAGKSTFARELAAIVGVPLIHLDRHFWGPGWTPTPREVWRARVRELAARPAWVMDGNYGGTVELRVARAHVVILLDLPRRVCLWRIVRRRLTARRRSRPDLPDGLPDRLTGEFVRWVWRYPHEGRVRLTTKLEAGPHVPVRALRTSREVAGFLSEVRERWAR